MVMQIKLVVVVVVVLEEHSQMRKENFEDKLVVSFLTLYGTSLLRLRQFIHLSVG